MSDKDEEGGEVVQEGPGSTGEELGQQKEER